MQKQYQQVVQSGFLYEVPKIKGSRFIGLVFQVSTKEQVQHYLDEVEQRYPDATHYCYAYRIGSVQKSSDDGEPTGTAGKPIMTALTRSGLDTILLVVVRYFGGTMLGAGGLLRAYGQCATDLLIHTPREHHELLQSLEFTCSYDDLSAVLQCIHTYEGTIISQDHGIFITIECQVNTGFVDGFIDACRSVTGGRVMINISPSAGPTFFIGKK